MGTPNNQRLPEEIYVRRRIAAVVVILVVVALVVWGLVSLTGGSDEEDPERAAQTTATSEESTPAEEETPESETTTAETEESGSETESAESSESSETTEPEEATTAGDAKQSCTLADLQITASSDQANYDGQTQPTFYMQVENPTAVDCEIDLSSNPMRFEVYDLATNQRIWSDIDCNEPIGEGEETFEAGSERNFQAVWSRTTSSPDNCGNREQVSAGSFFLHGVIGDNASNSHTFNMG